MSAQQGRYRYATPLPPARAISLRYGELQNYKGVADRIKVAADRGANVLLLDSYVAGYPLFPCDTRDEYGLKPFFPQLSDKAWDCVLDAAVSVHVAVFARVELLAGGDLRRGRARSPFLRRHRDWLVRDKARGKLLRSGDEESVWVAPWERQVQDYLACLLSELAEAYPISGFVFDAWQLPSQVLESAAVPENLSPFVPTLPPPLKETSPSGPTKHQPIEGEDAPESSDNGDQGHISQKQDAELLEELRELPYDLGDGSVYEQSLSLLFRTIRARSRRGILLPFALLRAGKGDDREAYNIVKSGFAEGLLIPRSECERVIEKVSYPFAVLWSESYDWQDHEFDKLPFPETGVVIGDGLGEMGNKFQGGVPNEDSVYGIDLPELTVESCIQAFRECLQRIATEWQPATEKLPAVHELESCPGTDVTDKKLALALTRLEKELEAILASKEQYDQTLRAWLWRAASYLELLRDYYQSY